MQKPPSLKSETGLDIDGIYITTYLGNQGDIDFSTVIDKPLIKFTSEDRYVHLPTQSFQIPGKGVHSNNYGIGIIKDVFSRANESNE
jgi:hypothetical protein